MSRIDDVFIPALSGKEIPILTLDNKWHKLFTQTEPTTQILRLEKRVNSLMKRQGKLNTESKDIRRLKKKLMLEIIELADDLEEAPDARTQKELDSHRRLVEECSGKLAKYRTELQSLPEELTEANYELMLATMEVCYDRIRENTSEIDALGKWIEETRIELKKNVIRKQEKEAKNQELYTYMHAIFGPRVIEMFDMKFNPDNKLRSGSLPGGEPVKEPPRKIRGALNLNFRKRLPRAEDDEDVDEPEEEQEPQTGPQENEDSE